TDPRRGDRRAGYRIRAPGAGCIDPPDARPHHAGDRASAVHHRTRRPGAGARPGTSGRTWHACRTVGAGRPVRASARHAVPRAGLMATGRATPPQWWSGARKPPIGARLLAAVFGRVVALRGALYRKGLLRSHGVDRPVIVV